MTPIEFRETPSALNLQPGSHILTQTIEKWILVGEGYSVVTITFSKGNSVQNVKIT